MVAPDARVTPDAQPNPDAGPPQVDAELRDRIPRIESGLYSMGVALTEFGGLEVPFQVEIEAGIEKTALRFSNTSMFGRYPITASASPSLILGRSKSQNLGPLSQIRAIR